ncbi:hypothetical protein [Flammeovirga kamogawensis]|uniref:Uncharacterized protein n=1 Tax=Flammeovirga kamogawensis TaxID=373891 RepID=A0ABX8H1B0_9BACT|nr:hypothetical protein [Flammeovirga kamogawensis]MBB6462370.1 hypothetical protein [Flammeovirga kamogawensis]QWG09483.1 hypothetical protein KM029_23030 [Flammeovirga kamogawensis]TRX64999.1 hypothetical protein EO216_20930 [Flammeovirga kamogawensis]
MKSLSLNKYISLLLIGVFGVVLSVTAQTEKVEEDEVTKAERLKYEDIDYKKYFPLIKPSFDTRIEDPILQDLKKIRQYQPFEVSPIFQISEYYFQRIDEFDVLREYHAIHSTCDSALQYINEFQARLDEKEVKKKGKRYYMEFLKFPANAETIDEKVSLLHINKELERRKEVLALQKSEVDSIYMNFKASINEYLIANEIFRDVCGTYSTIKDLYIMAENDSLFPKLATMKMHYEKSLEYFALYKAAATIHPFEGYTQEYTIKPIENYRIHGLTRTSFLTMEIDLWDYAKWHDDVLAYYQAEIVNMRLLVDSYDTELDKIIQQKQATSSPSEDRFYLDSRKIGKIKKYDPSAYPVEIFKYKEQKVNLLNQIAYSNIQFNGNKVDLKYIRSQAEVWTESLKASKALNNIHTSSADIGYIKHANFYKMKYNDNLPSYITYEKQFIADQTVQSEKLLKELVVTYFSKVPVEKAEFIPYKKDSISVTPVSDKNLFGKRKYTTMYVRPNKNNHKLLIGTINNEKEFGVFVADLDSTQKITWVKAFNYNRKEYQGIPTIDIPSIRIKSGMLHVLMAVQGIKTEAVDMSLSSKVGVVNLSSGEVIHEQPLSTARYPRAFNFLQEQKSYLIAYKGKSKNNLQHYDTLSIQNVRMDGELIWNSEFMMKGMINDIIGMPSSYILVANVNKLATLDGKATLTATSETFGQFNTALLKLDAFGKPLDATILKSTSPYEATFALTDFDNTINIIGVKGAYDPNADFSNRDIILVTLKANNLKVVEKNIQ